MVNFFINSNVLIQTILSTLMTFGVTALGAAIVFIFKKVFTICEPLPH